MSLTEEQVNEIFKDVEVRFWSYYKYSFTFIGFHSPEIGDPGWQIYVTLGGNSDAVYSLSVERYKKIKFRVVNNWNSVVVETVSKGGATREVFNHYNPLA